MITDPDVVVALDAASLERKRSQCDIARAVDIACQSIRANSGILFRFVVTKSIPANRRTQVCSKIGTERLPADGRVFVPDSTEHESVDTHGSIATTGRVVGKGVDAHRRIRAAGRIVVKRLIAKRAIVASCR